MIKIDTSVKLVAVAVFFVGFGLLLAVFSIALNVHDNLADELPKISEKEKLDSVPVFLQNVVIIAVKFLSLIILALCASWACTKAAQLYKVTKEPAAKPKRAKETSAVQAMPIAAPRPIQSMPPPPKSPTQPPIQPPKPA